MSSFYDFISIHAMMELTYALFCLTLVSCSVADTAVDELKKQIISEVKQYFDEELELLKQKHDSEVRELDIKLARSKADIAHLKSQNEVLAKKLENALLMINNWYRMIKQPWGYLRKYGFKQTQNSLHIKDTEDYRNSTDRNKSHMKIKMISRDENFINKESFPEKDRREQKPSDAGRSLRQVNTPMPDGSGVAFFAVLNNHYLNTSSNQDIVFDKVITNIGGGFHNSSSLFVAPIPGVYVFSFSVITQGKHGHIKLVKNGQLVVRANTGNSWDESSQFAVLQLNKGDYVAVRNDDTSGINYHGDFYSSFAGFLLYDYTEITPVLGK